MASVKREKEKWEKFLVERRVPYPYPKDNTPLVIARTSLLKPVAPPSAALREENSPPHTEVFECRIDIPPRMNWSGMLMRPPPPDEAYWEYDIENPPPRTDPWGFETPPPEDPEPKRAQKRVSLEVNDVRNISVAEPEGAESSDRKSVV